MFGTLRTLGLILLLLFGLQPAEGSFTRAWTDATETNPVLRLYDAAEYQTRLTTTASPPERDILQNPSLSPAPTGSKRRLEFDYDYLGRRIGKRVYVNGAGTPAVDLKFVYDGWNLIAELNETDNSLVRAYIWGLDLSGSLQGAGGTGGLIAVVDATEGTHFAVLDGSGNVAGLVDADTGVRSATYEYDPFGQIIRATGPAADLNPFRFSTRHADVESGMLYYGYRYYNPSTGRWLNRDPIGEVGGLNLYGFVGNDPANYVDVLGLAVGDWWDPRTQWCRAKGAAKNVWETGEDLVDLATTDPRETIQNIADAAYNYEETYEAIKDELTRALEEYMQSKKGCIDPCLALEMEGALASEAAMMAAGPGLLAKAGKLGRLAEILKAARARVAAKGAAIQPNRIYSARELIRRAEEPGPFHNFPESFNQQIFENGTRTVTPNYFNVPKPGLTQDGVMYQLRGSVNGVNGTFEIGVRPSVSGNTEVIGHRFFRPDP